MRFGRARLLVGGHPAPLLPEEPALGRDIARRSRLANLPPCFLSADRLGPPPLHVGLDIMLVFMLQSDERAQRLWLTLAA